MPNNHPFSPMYVGGTVQGHPLVQIPNPHEAEHPGLAQMTSSSIIPCLRFYSFTFRVLILLGLALIVISAPLFRLVRVYGWKAPEVFRNQTGLATFNSNFRSLTPYSTSYRHLLLHHHQPTLSLLDEFILNSIAKLY